VRKQRKPFQSQSQCVFPYFWVWVVSSNFLKLYWFQFEIWQTFVVFCKFVHFQGIFFPNTSCIFVFTIATIFSRDSRQHYRFMHKCNSTLNTLSLIANQSAALPLAMRFYIDDAWVNNWLLIVRTLLPVFPRWCPVFFSVSTNLRRNVSDFELLLANSCCEFGSESFLILLISGRMLVVY